MVKSTSILWKEDSAFHRKNSSYSESSRLQVNSQKRYTAGTSGVQLVIGNSVQPLWLMRLSVVAKIRVILVKKSIQLLKLKRLCTLTQPQGTIGSVCSQTNSLCCQWKLQRVIIQGTGHRLEVCRGESGTSFWEFIVISTLPSAKLRFYRKKPTCFGSFS